jgi:hypothetical protein
VQWDPDRASPQSVRRACAPTPRRPRFADADPQATGLSPSLVGLLLTL